MAPFVEVAETLPHEAHVKVTPPFVVPRLSDLVVTADACTLPLVEVISMDVALRFESRTLPFVVVSCTEPREVDWGTYTWISTV